MSEHDRMLFRLGQLLTRIARPHRVDEGLPADLQTMLLQVGVSCDATTSRADLVARLWAQKRTMLDTTPPSAA